MKLASNMVWTYPRATSSGSSHNIRIKPQHQDQATASRSSQLSGKEWTRVALKLSGYGMHDTIHDTIYCFRVQGVQCWTDESAVSVIQPQRRTATIGQGPGTTSCRDCEPESLHPIGWIAEMVGSDWLDH